MMRQKDLWRNGRDSFEGIFYLIIFFGIPILIIAMSYLAISYFSRGPSTYLGIELGTPVSLQAINSKYTDESCLCYERVGNDSIIFSFKDTEVYNYYPKSPLPGLLRYQVVVDKNNKEIIAVCAEGDKNNSYLRLLNYGDSALDRTFKSTANWIKQNIPGFTCQSVGNSEGFEFGNVYEKNFEFFNWPFTTRPSQVWLVKTSSGSLAQHIRVVLIISRYDFDCRKCFF